MQGLNKNKQQITGGTPQRGRSSFNTARNTNVKELQHINTAIYVAKRYLKKAKDRNKELKNIFGESATSFEQLRNEFINQKRESLVGNSKAILYNQLEIITTSCFIKKEKIAMT